MNTFQLSCFLAVAEYLNFAQAAQALHVTHPAVSQQIKSLEKELGAPLFVRTTRSVSLTEEGKAFLPDAQQIVALSRRATKRFSTGLDNPIEMLTIGCYSSACMILLADALEQLRSMRPPSIPISRQSRLGIYIKGLKAEIWMRWWGFGKRRTQKSMRFSKNYQNHPSYASAPEIMHWRESKRFAWKI